MRRREFLQLSAGIAAAAVLSQQANAQVVPKEIRIGAQKGGSASSGPDAATTSSGAPLLVGALAAIDCEVEDIIERHSHGIVIGHVREVQVVPEGSALAY